MKQSGSKSATVLCMCIWVRKLLDADLDRKLSKSNRLEQIRLSFGKMYLDLKEVYYLLEAFKREAAKLGL